MASEPKGLEVRVKVEGLEKMTELRDKNGAVLREGDEVVASYRGVVCWDGRIQRLDRYNDGYSDWIDHAPEELERIDDPAKDPVGTVRRHAEGDYVKNGAHGWCRLFSGSSSNYCRNDFELRDCPIVARLVWEEGCAP